jgi:radical SAM family uncharacterized protein
LLTNREINELLERILMRVQKPGRYVGGEFNQVVKRWDDVSTHVALVFPDIYDLGLPNLGLAILYETLNKRQDVLAERAYVPWLDMESEMRQAGIPLYSLESKHPLAGFDIVGISLPYENLYSNTLNLLDLAGIPLKSADRTDQHPLIIAGGHACYNPEPMSDFIDAFVIGEGEQIIDKIVDVHQACQKRGIVRRDLLRQLAMIPGIYVPEFYRIIYRDNGTIEGVESLVDQASLPVHRHLVAQLPPAPTHFLVPSINVVHNRVSVEIMRGCTRGCRFCHAGIVTRPVRERPVQEIVETIQEALDNTGFEEVALLSLSSSDYSHILELVEAISRRFTGKHLTISLPSLRIESFSIELLEQLRGSRQGGFTLAPEAATERMRSIINKPIQTSQLLETAQAIFSRGWSTIKLYFMIGHPRETIEDVQAIADLCKQVLAVGRRSIGKRAALHVGVSTFVPKPHTPFQWVQCDDLEQIEIKQRLLRRELSSPAIKYNWTDPKETMLEAFLSRGDRRLGQVILSAWQKGARFDAWQEQFKYDAWEGAFKEAGLDMLFYTHRERSGDEVFPWDHIHAGVKRTYLRQDYEWSLEGKLRPDCREQCYACGILPHYRDLRRQNPGPVWKCPEVAAEE